MGGGLRSHGPRCPPLRPIDGTGSRQIVRRPVDEQSPALLAVPRTPEAASGPRAGAGEDRTPRTRRGGREGSRLRAGAARLGGRGVSVVAVVLTLNEEENVVPCLESLAWADRRIVFDSFSGDGTVELARGAGADVLQHPFENYAQQRNAALEQIGADWVFFVDADERATPELAEEVREITSEERDEVAWWVPRHNYIFGRLTLGAGWFPDYQVRLVRPARVRWERPVHEIAVADGPEGYLKTPRIHYTSADLADFLARQDRYTAVDVGILLR
ncbi:MAG: glycosyltransferase family 2 protein, partial [Anaerolineales bacterium]